MRISFDTAGYAFDDFEVLLRNFSKKNVCLRRLKYLLKWLQKNYRRFGQILLGKNYFLVTQFFLCLWLKIKARLKTFLTKQFTFDVYIFSKVGNIYFLKKLNWKKINHYLRSNRIFKRMECLETTSHSWITIIIIQFHEFFCLTLHDFNKKKIR